MAAISLGTHRCLSRATQAFALSTFPRCNAKLSLWRTISSEPLAASCPPASGVTQIVQALKGEEGDVLLRGVKEKSTIKEVKHILEMAQRALSRQEVLHTNFLTPPVLKESMEVMGKLAGVKAIAQGGYPQAERCRISVGHPEELTSDPDIIAALSITGNFQFEPCSHGDFLGSILSTGITREKLGDIILQVGNVPVSCSQIPLISLDYEPPRTKSFKTIEASLRVDALASAGFKISRSKLVDLIGEGAVRVNWVPVTTKGAALKSGDIVSVSGRGRLKIGEINSTKKGKFAVELIRYL
ncbi:uncharacterized protein LOC129298724 isoform X2 [Prosopis cineraria]|uniref:uncharacterized protein LOC129298724 isoform X2 n=1 Tax=Prosopis cineraria TaxID=364024 RepID=UPI00240FFAE7|nr:uncharacterized protein LOC129298724 isoform X2 [Prosopis cineraria]